MRVAAIKEAQPISIAGAFAAALAQQEVATFVSGDPGFCSLADIIDIIWLGQ